MAERVWLDRIEGERAVLLLGEEGRETATIPRRLLPSDAREGMALDLSLAPAPEDETRERVQGLMDDLFGA
ncbi:MAG: DUF3006 domain-containing protein [Armatimonadota bacterium]